MVLMGFLLGISISVAIASLGIIITGATGILKENLITGNVIGPADAASYAIISFIVSLIITFILIFVMRKKKTVEVMI